MHLRDEPVLNEGEPVIQGEILGYVGKTGTNVVHLHIAYYRDSSNLDLEPRLDSSNPMHILPETNRGLYQISEESMRVVNEGTTSAPDYWLEFDFYVPPYQVDLERLEYDLYLALENTYTRWPGVSGNTSLPVVV